MRGKPGIGTGVMKLLEGATSTAEGPRVDLDFAYSNWALQVVGASTDLAVVLRGGLASSSDATLTTIATWSSTDGSGATVFASGKPASVVSATITGGASSGGASAWAAGAP